MYFQLAITNRIKDIAEKYKISYSKWAINAGLAPATLYDLINGKTEILELVSIKKLCDVIKMPLTEFFSDKDILEAKIKEKEWISKD